MKRIAISALALALLAGPTAQAMAAPVQHRAGGDVVAQYHGSRHHEAKRHHHRHQRWHKGHRYSEWKRHKPVRNYHRHGLRRPVPGHHWIRVGNDYLLVGAVSGLIASIVVAR
ncbi:RcnB family protein [Pseudaminobacter sp. 19-2017]|uniref:RcnB family protein n=1 Tax=Pseudaminobacter soli (ex Zhang et al. 2022) TaxID=2831468 RepID=A0A942E4F6_9HYPH|nr:RcnB family protein [Pseudaminobacter soli]